MKMKRLYDWFWEKMDEQGANGRGGRVVAGLMGGAVLLFGFLVIWILTLVHNFGHKLPDLGNK